MTGVRGNIDILMISETKLHASFPTSQILITGYTSPYRLDQNCKDGRILVYAREDILSKLITTNFPNEEDFFLEINLRKKKWIIYCSYNPHNQTTFSHMENMGKAVDSLSSKYKNVLILGDFSSDKQYFCEVFL